LDSTRFDIKTLNIAALGLKVGGQSASSFSSSSSTPSQSTLVGQSSTNSTGNATINQSKQQQQVIATGVGSISS